MNFIKQIINKCVQFKCPLTKQKLSLLHDLSTNYEVTDKACWFYRNKVNNNKNDKYITIKNKLIRNIILGEIVADYDDLKVYNYGNLIISIDIFRKRIFYVSNRVGYYELKINENKKKWLNHKLGLDTISGYSNVKMAKELV